MHYNTRVYKTGYRNVISGRLKYLEGSRVKFLEGSCVEFLEGSCVKLKFESIDHDFYNCVCRMLDNFGKVIETIRHCRSHARMQKEEGCA